MEAFLLFKGTGTQVNIILLMFINLKLLLKIFLFAPNESKTVKA